MQKFNRLFVLFVCTISIFGCAKNETDIAPPDISKFGEISDGSRVIACSAKTFADSNETLHFDILKSNTGKTNALYIYRTVLVGSRSSGWSVSTKGVTLIEFDKVVESSDHPAMVCDEARKQGAGAELCTQKVGEVLPAQLPVKFFYKEGSQFSALWIGGNDSLLLAKTARATYFVDCKKQQLFGPNI